MRHVIFILSTIGLFLSTSYLNAADLSDKWSLGISGGIGFTLGPDEASDYLPTSFVVTGDLTYMFAENFGFIPVSLSYHNLFFDKDKFADDFGFSRSDLDEINTSVWIISYTPGLMFRSSPESKTRVFGEVGAGFYHYNWEVGVPSFPEFTEKDDGNNFSARFGGGIEIDFADNAAFVSKGRLNVFKTETETITIFDLMGGIKFYF